MKKYNLKNFDKYLVKNPILKTLLSDDEFVECYKLWETNNGVFFNDYIWLLFNKALVKIGKEFSKTDDEFTFHWNNSIVYRAMGHLRREEGADSSTINKFMRLAIESDVQKDKIQVLNGSGIVCDIKVLSTKGACNYADSISENRYEFDEFNDKCKIATDVCNDNYGFCRCTISAVPRRDENGRVVRRKII